MELIHLIYFLGAVQLSYQKSTPEADTYRAAVVEFAAENPGTNPPIERNCQRYVEYIKQAGHSDVDIIVFPEDGLTGVSIPVERETLDAWTTRIPVNHNPCEKNETGVSEAMNRISCAARDAKVYVVINIAEKSPCGGEGCPREGQYFYNSQAVFDRDGKIIAKYRKTHLFSEPQFDRVYPPEVVTFDTDFNVTFGMFICFDIYFKEPALTLTRVHNVTDIVYSVAWFSELPFLTAVEMHGGWAYSENVNLLASGYNRPMGSNTGSGIYLGEKGIAQVTFGKSGDEMIISDVPKKNRHLLSETVEKNIVQMKSEKKEHKIHDELNRKKRAANTTTGFVIWQDDLHLYESCPMNWSVRQHKLCQKDFCCDFTIEASSIDLRSTYKLILFNGNRTFANSGNVTAGVQTCALVLCANESMTSCGLQLTSKTKFSSFKISTTFVNPDDLLVLPSSSNSSLLPLNWTYSKISKGHEVNVEAVLNEPAENVLTLGIYARKFDRDVTYLTERSTATSLSTAVRIQIGVFVILIILSIAVYSLYRNRFRFGGKESDSQLQSSYHHIPDNM